MTFDDFFIVGWSRGVYTSAAFSQTVYFFLEGMLSQ